MPEERKRFHLVVIRNQCSPKPQHKVFHNSHSSQFKLNCGRVTSRAESENASPKKLKNVVFFLQIRKIECLLLH